MALVLMDVDGTLLPTPSSETRFIAHLALRAKLGPVQLVAALGFYACYWHRFGAHVGRKNKAYLTNLSRDRVTELAHGFVGQRLLPRLRPEVLARLRKHQRAGDQVALLTGAPDFLVEPLAHALGIDTWSATECDCRDGRFGWRPPPHHPLAEEKLIAAQRLCALHEVALSESIAYADSIHDLALLERVAQPVAVHPDRALAQAARRRGWELLDHSAASGSLKVPE